MGVNQLEKAQEFRSFLIANNINYRELNLTHFHIFDSKGELIAQVWPSTESCIWHNTGIHYTGMSMIGNAILGAYKDVEPKDSLRAQFEQYQEQIKYARKLITVTELPTGALEVQINDSALISKYQYIIDAYDDQMRLKSNPEIHILDFIIV